MSEELFWNVDLSFLISVLYNKLAYDEFISYTKELERENMYKNK